MGEQSFTTSVVILLLLLFFITLSTADIKSFTITSDTRPLILFEKFGFTEKGYISVGISHISVEAKASAEPNTSLLGFFFLNEDLFPMIRIESELNPSFCILDSKYIFLLFTFPDLNDVSALTHTSHMPLSGENSLFFANCAPDSSVSMSLHTKFCNLDRGFCNYLSDGQTYLPFLFFLFSIAYFTFLFFWLYLCYYSNRHSLHWIHHLMTSFLLVKAFNVFCAAEVNHYVKVTGTPHGWDVPFYIFQFIHAVLLFAVIVLIGTGWSFLKPFLQEKGKKVLMSVIPLQVLANVAAIVVHKTGPFIMYWVTWNLILFLLDFISCVVIFFFVWSMRSLKVAERNLDRFTLIRRFYVFVIGYLLFTYFILFALKDFVPYKYQWVSNLVEESVNLAFCIIMFHLFRPSVRKEECFLIDEQEEEVAETAVEG